MTFRSAIITAAVAAACACLSVPASAAQKIVTFYADPEDGGKSGYSVTFTEECGDECQIASFSCDESRSFFIEYADVSGEDVAKSITAPGERERRLTLTIGNEAHVLTAWKLTYAEMTGSWWVEAQAQDSAKAMTAISKAKDMQISFAKQKQRLPVNADVKRWVTNCLK